MKQSLISNDYTCLFVYKITDLKKSLMAILPLYLLLYNKARIAGFERHAGKHQSIEQ
jgi:hypothetical protein